MSSNNIRYVIFNLKDLFTGLPPWEDNSYYKTVNGYHNEALQKFRHMTRDELESSARTRIENMDVEDKIPLDEELDKVLCTKELLIYLTNTYYFQR